ncbi:hypothetical protein [Paucibacter soli]|uniref:hypothetical protein n=1 Tax=Paucibacter soli TaxID=3133433 RepID=UPI0030A981EB
MATNTITFLPYSVRFQEALSLLCTEKPAIELCVSWIERQNEELQGWVASHLRADWAQGIGTIDAARLMAELCEEGRPEMLSEAGERVARYLVKTPILMIRRGNSWRPKSCPPELDVKDIMEFRSRGLAVLDHEMKLRLSGEYSLPAYLRTEQELISSSPETRARMSGL